MYDEDSFKATLFWLRIRKILIVVFFTLVFFLIGFVASEYLVDIIELSSIIRVVSIAGSTILGFVIGAILTADVEYKIQRGYYNIAVLRKLSVISKKLDKIDDEELEKLDINSSKLRETVQNSINNQNNSVSNVENKDNTGKTIEIKTVSPITDTNIQKNNVVSTKKEINVSKKISKNKKNKNKVKIRS